MSCLWLCLWRRWCSGRRLTLLWGRAAWCARGRRPARSPSAPRAALGASSRSPARPCRRPRVLQPGPATAHGGWLQPGLTTAHGRRQALRCLQCPSHRRCLWFWCVRAPTPPMGAAACSLLSLAPPTPAAPVLQVCPARPHRRVYAPIRVPVKEISPQHGAFVRGMALH